jgi:hypothetical protein
MLGEQVQVECRKDRAVTPQGERRTFRVTEDRTFADIQDQPTTLDGVGEVSIVHPLHLSEEERNAWGGLLGDYEIIPPFPQLGRVVYRLEGEERQATVLHRFATSKIPGVSLAVVLEKTGWQRGTLHDHGDFTEYYKPFPPGA